MALCAELYSVEADIAESGIFPFCIPSASKHTGGFGFVKPIKIQVQIAVLEVQ